MLSYYSLYAYKIKKLQFIIYYKEYIYIYINRHIDVILLVFKI